MSSEEGEWLSDKIMWYCIRWNIGGTLIWQIAKILCIVDLMLVVDARGRDLNTLVYIWVKSFYIGSPYQNRQSAKLKIC